MPGRIETHTLEVHATFRQALAQAGLEHEGYEVKLDGSPITDLDTVVPLTSDTILLSKRVKGNADMLNIKIGVMPGRVGSYALELGTSYAKALEIAGLDTDGFEVKVDGTPVTNFDSAIHAGADTILLSKRVKGNSGVVKIGVMPGRVDSFGLEAGTTYAQAFAIAGVDPEGYEVKADGAVITDYNQVVGAVDTVLLSKRVKGNSGFTVKIGVMPGRIESYGLEAGTTYAKAFEIAGIDPEGFEAKADGTVINNFDILIQPGIDTILLSKRVKGNK